LREVGLTSSDGAGKLELEIRLIGEGNGSEHPLPWRAETSEARS
jgi:hypothetical protein